MDKPTTYEIVIRGRATERLLGPLVDDFVVDHPVSGRTRLTGLIRDPAHLHGVMAHLTSVTAEVISLTQSDTDPTNTSNDQKQRTNQGKAQPMTTSLTNPETTPVQRRGARAGAIGALIAAATFIFGIALFVTSLSDYTSGDPTVAESVAFLGEHETTFFVWYLVIFLLFGAAIIPLARALHHRLRPTSPLLADVGAVFAYIWAGLMFATGMISNIGITVITDLAETNPEQAEAVWSSVGAVTNGLGGGNELVGGMWVLLVSLAAWATNALPRSLNALGIISAASGLITVVPGLEDVGLVFGLGLIVWFAWVGIVLFRSDNTPQATSPQISTERSAR